MYDEEYTCTRKDTVVTIRTIPPDIESIKKEISVLTEPRCIQLSTGIYREDLIIAVS